MTDITFNKFRAAASVLQRGRDQLVDSMADEILDQSESILEGGFLFHELLENHGTRLHFLCLLVAQLEHSADELDERRAAAKVVSKPRSRKPRTKASKPVDSSPTRGKSAHEREAPPEES